MNNKRHGLRAETALRDILNARGYLCIRSAASKLVDLVALDSGGFCFFIEVKAVLGDTYRTSRTAFQREQHLEMMRYASIYGTEEIIFLYVIRYGDGQYRAFPIDREIFRYDEGMPLDDAFPSVFVSALPNNPPIVPRSNDALGPDGDGPVYPEYDATGGATD